MRRPKSWQGKLTEEKGLPRVERISGPHKERYGGGTMLIPSPAEIDAVMKQVPRGKLITISEIREILAARHGTKMTCPVTTGIFAWVCAHAAAEAAEEGKKRITPYWRTLKAGGRINRKYPGGVRAVAKLLKAEGHKVESRGIHWYVADYEKSLVKLA